MRNTLRKLITAAAVALAALLPLAANAARPSDTRFDTTFPAACFRVPADAMRAKIKAGAAVPVLNDDDKL